MKVNQAELNLKDEVICINRVAKVVNGGSRFNFTALVVVGDDQGWVGIGKGKAAEVPEAISKAVQHAKKNLVRISIKNGTISHEVLGHFGPSTSCSNRPWPAPGLSPGARSAR